MNPVRWTLYTILVILVESTLPACSAESASEKQTPPTKENEALLQEEAADQLSNSSQAESNPSVVQTAGKWPDGHAQWDDQGAVEVVIIPLNLNKPGGTMDFEVELNTHSVDLSMDLSALATLRTDTGKIVQASLWEAPRGGHHVSGVLSFPASVDGVPLLDGAKKLILTLVYLDAPERVFNWERL